MTFNIKVAPYKLFCFDVTNTLIAKDGRILDGVQEQFAALSAMKSPPWLAFLSNQGDVGLRHWMTIERFGSLDFVQSLPVAHSIAQAHQELAKQLTRLDVVCLQAYAYQNKDSLKWSPSPYPANLAAMHPQWLPSWRKPSPGMLLAAMKRTKSVPAETIMISNSSDDYEAAAAAKVTFMWADEFFDRDTRRDDQMPY